jgi:hypothetical protein
MHPITKAITYCLFQFAFAQSCFASEGEEEIEIAEEADEAEYDNPWDPRR